MKIILSGLRGLVLWACLQSMTINGLYLSSSELSQLIHERRTAEDDFIQARFLDKYPAVYAREMHLDPRLERRESKQSMITTFFKPVPKAKVPNFSRPFNKSPAQTAPLSPSQHGSMKKEQSGPEVPNWPLPPAPLPETGPNPKAPPAVKKSPTMPVSAASVKPEEKPPTYEELHVKKNFLQRMLLVTSDHTAYKEWKKDEAALSKANHQNKQVKSGLKKFCDDSDKCYVEASAHATDALALHKLENESKLSDYTLQKAERDSRFYYTDKITSAVGTGSGIITKVIRRRDLEKYLMVRSLIDSIHAVDDDI